MQVPFLVERLAEVWVRFLICPHSPGFLLVPHDLTHSQLQPLFIEAQQRGGVEGG